MQLKLNVSDLSYGFTMALENLLQINAITYTSEYPQKCHLLPKTGKYIRAGFKYEKPWTRDAAVNATGGGSLLDPELARNTLFAVCEDSPEGVRIQEDNQWWDRLIWIVAAWEHYLITGDEDFLQKAYPIAKLSFQRTVKEYFNEQWGLFRGPAFMEDGISAYPAPVFKEGVFNPFVLRYEMSHHIMCLSTNCAYYKAALCLAEMAQKVGESQQYAAFARDLKASILKHLRKKDGSFVYFLYGSGDLEGQPACYSETVGIAFAVLFGVVEGDDAKKALGQVQVEPVGVTSMQPHFERFSDTMRGRHNGCYWPMIGGYFAHAAARCGDEKLFARQTEDLARLVRESDGNFYEVYDPVTGAPDGGWQIDVNGFYHLPPYPHQTWSATAYLRMILQGLFGMAFAEDGVYLAPTLPEHWGSVELSHIAYRNMTLSIRLEGSGTQIKEFTIDGVACPDAKIPADLTGSHQVRVVLG